MRFSGTSLVCAFAACLLLLGGCGAGGDEGLLVAPPDPDPVPAVITPTTIAGIACT